MIELSGIDRVETSETERGVYEVTIWGNDSTYLRGNVSVDVVEAVKSSGRLFVSVSKPKLQAPESRFMGISRPTEDFRRRPRCFGSDALCPALSLRGNDFSYGSRQPILMLPSGLSGLIKWQSIRRYGRVHGLGMRLRRTSTRQNAVPSALNEGC